MADKLPTDGAFGAPPPNAPYEVAQPIQGATPDQLARAHANERQLQPLVFGVQPRPEPPVTADDVLEQTFAAPPPTEEPARKTMTPAMSEQATADPIDRSHQPAASNTDSPSRGIPKPIDDPGKRITGGFGDLGEAQYYALDGLELKELAKHLLGKLLQQIENDLHFSMAITYPRVEIKVSVGVSGYAKEGAFELFKGSSYDKTTVENAVKAGAEPIAFELSEGRAEFDAAGEPTDAPDRIRDELGLEKPHKQVVQMGSNRSIVDRAPNLGGSF